MNPTHPADKANSPTLESDKPSPIELKLTREEFNFLHSLISHHISGAVGLTDSLYEKMSVEAGNFDPPLLDTVIELHNPDKARAILRILKGTPSP